MATRAKDYREDQSRKDWWDGKMWWLGGMTRSDMMWIGVGVILAILYFKFLPNMDWVFGPRAK